LKSSTGNAFDPYNLNSTTIGLGTIFLLREELQAVTTRSVSQVTVIIGTGEGIGTPGLQITSGSIFVPDIKDF